MATTIESQGTQRYVDFDEYIDFQLQKAGSGIKSTDILTALAGVAALVLGYLLVFVVFDHWVIAGGFGQVSRIVMLALLGVLTIAWLVWKVGIPWIRQVNRLYAARMIERADPSLKDSLLTLVDLRRAGKPVPPEILAAIEKRAALGISHIDLDHAVDRRPLARAGYALCAVVLIFCAYTLFSPKKISHSIWRALFPTAAVAAPTRTEILDVQPGDAEILARTQLEVTATLRGDIPEQVTLLYSTADRRFVDEPLEMREAGDELLRPAEPEQSGPRQYRVMIAGENGRGILQDMTYRIVAGDAVTPDYKITVDQPPSTKVDQVRYEYPDYMELEPRDQPSGHITAWEGTKVTLAATANMPVTSARLEFLKESDSASRVFDLPMQISDGTQLRAEWKLTISPDGTYPRYYRIQVRNEEEEVDPQPTVYSLTIRPDQPPDVTLIDPTRDLERPANAIVPLLLQARDPDFKLSYLTLRIEKNGEPIPAGVSIFDGPPRPSFATTFEWDLKQHDLEPGDTLTYWIEARDNKTPDGNRRNTPKLNINIVEPVTPEEAAEQLQQEKKRQQQNREGAARDENQENAPEPPPQQEGDPQQRQDQQQDGQQGDQAQPMPGEQGQQQEDGQQGEQQQQQPGQSGEQQSGGQRSGEGQQGAEEQLDPNGNQDAEAIRKFLENQQQQEGAGQQGEQPPPEQGNQPQEQRREGDTPQAGDQSQERQPNDGQNAPQEQQPSGKQPQGDQQSPSDNNEQPSDAGQDGQQGTGKQPGTPGEQGNEPGEASDPSQGAGKSEGPMNPGASKTGEPSTGEPMPPSADPANRAAEQTDAQNQDGQKGEPAGTPERTDEKATEGASGQKGDPKGDEQQQTGGKPSGQEQGTEQEKPAPADQGDQRAGEAPREQTGEKADPNGEQKQASEQTGEAPMDSAEPTQQGKGDPRDGSDARKGTQNPREADPAQQLKQQPNQPQQDQPDQRSSEPSELGADQPPAKRDGQPEGANEPPQGEGAKEDQRSKSTDGGEVGSGNQSDQGKSGSNERGPGDSVDQPGNKGEQADQPSGGQKGLEKGPGSQSREAGDQQGEPAGGEDGPKKDGGDAQGSEQGGGKKGEPTNQTGPGQTGEQQPTEGGQAGDSPAGDAPSGGHGNRPGRAGAEQPDGQGDAQPQPSPNQAEQANEEYGREAANMVLKKLEDQIKEGEIDQKWLEETGWTEEQAKGFAERLRKHLSQDQPATPEELTRQRQFDEMLRTLRKPDVGAPRSGDNVREAPAPGGITGPRRLPVPREYRELYEEYTRSRAKRTSPSP